MTFYVNIFCFDASRCGFMVGGVREMSRFVVMKKLYWIIIILLACRVCDGQNPNWQWAVRAGGTDQSFSEGDFISGIKNDVQGNIFALGSFTQNADFGPFTLAGNANYSQLFLAKLNPAGVFQWVVSTTGPGRVFAEHIEIDDSSNIYVTAVFQMDTVYLQGDTLIPMNVQLPQILIAKFDLNGNKIWTRTFQSLGANESGFIKCNSNNQLVFCYAETPPYLSSGLGYLKLGNLNMANGSVLNLQTIGRSRSAVSGLEVNNDNNTIIYVNLYDSLYTPTDTFLIENGCRVLLCVDSNFNKVFSKQIPVSYISNSSFNGLVLDNNANIYTCGYFVDTLVIGSDTLYNPPSNFSSNSYLLSLDKLGNYRWVKHFNSSFENWVTALFSDTMGNCYATGEFLSNISIDSITGFGFQNRDIFVTKCDTSGNFSWIKTAGGTDDDFPDALSVSQNGKIYIGGYFNNNCTIGNTSFLSVGTYDAFLAKLSNPIVSGLQESLTNDNSLIVTPNPFTDNLTITLNKKEPVELTLYDITSRKLLQQTFTTSTTINTSQLAKGIYIYEVRNDRGIVKQGKVVKE